MKRYLVIIRKLTLLGLLIGVASWSWWLNLEPESPIAGSGTRDADPGLEFYAQGLEVSTLDARGKHIRTLRSEGLKQYQDSGITELVSPQLQIFEQGDNPQWQVTAERGQLSADGSELLLSGKVNIDQQRSINGFPLHIVTSDLRIEPEKHYAETDAPVTINNGENWMKSVGMQAWLQKPAQIKFLTRTRGYYVNQ